MPSSSLTFQVTAPSHRLMTLILRSPFLRIAIFDLSFRPHLSICLSVPSVSSYSSLIHQYQSRSRPDKLYILTPFSPPLVLSTHSPTIAHTSEDALRHRQLLQLFRATHWTSCDAIAPFETRTILLGPCSNIRRLLGRVRGPRACLRVDRTAASRSVHSICQHHLREFCRTRSQRISYA